ncbi:chaperonin GroEL [Streptomyces phaeochromogenes]|uniref:chaperonin GroEL n=1 Tax=Streptomyces phaeochromogenes TaxID=1923 RepID=UPI002E29F36E|nr:chaperonin GroEL [Streptomyces phaeochromogenes]
MGRRRALLIATADYEDTRWNPLEAPLRDAEELGSVLEDPAIGRYEVTKVLNQQAHIIQRELLRFFAAARLDDELLVYFSCHGIKDYDEALFFAASNTDKERELLESCSVPAEFVSRHLERCSARRKVLLLDCCFSGAFRPGSKGGDPTIDFGNSFNGSGTVVISATDETQLAFELDPETNSGLPSLSVFTSTVVGGLRTGDADVDGDGLVSAEDLYKYVTNVMHTVGAGQTPKLWLLDGVGSLAIAERAQWTEAATAMPAPIRVDRVPRGTAAPDAPLRGHAAELLNGIAPMADLLRRTIGPLPRPAVVTRADGSIGRFTDTSMIVRESALPSGRAAIGANLLRELVERMRTRAGDGGATAALIFESMVRTLQPAIAAGVNPVLVSRSVADLFGRAENILGPAVDVQTKEMIAKIVRTATAADPMIGELIAEAMDKIGREGVITVEESQTFGLELELTEGMAFNRGYLSPHFATDEESGEAVLDDPHILLYQGTISSISDLLPLLEKIMQAGRPLLVIADDVEGEALSTLVVNKVRDTFKSVAVKAPGFLDHRKAVLGDLAAITGATVVAEGFGPKLDHIGLDALGRARKAVITKGETTLVDGAGGVSEVTARVNRIRAEIESSDSDYDREKLRERLAKMAGGVATIRAGAMTQSERENLTALLRSAVRSAKMAVTDGIVPGAASALAVVGAQVQPAADSQAADDAAATAAGVLAHALAQALQQPLCAVAANSGDTDTEALTAGAHAAWPRFTYDARSSSFAEAGVAGVWDPITVPRIVLDEVARSVKEFLSVI